jgi:carboxypeptidase Taq
MSSAYADLERRLREVHSLNKAASLLEWDHQVCMPPGGGPARGEQTSLLRRLAHEKLIDPEVGRLIDSLKDDRSQTKEAALVRWARREHDFKRKLPAELVQEISAHASHSHDVWVQARAQSDFALFLPELEKMLELKRRQAEILALGDDPYDSWLIEFEPDMKTADLAAILSEVKAGLVPLVKAVCASKHQVDDSALRRPFDEEKQRAFAAEMAAAIGFDFSRGRLDLAAHPFCSGFSSGDVRITTRFRDDYPLSSLFSALHEAGHGIYDQNLGADLHGTPLCEGSGMGMHESQSRLWENVIGRSLGFWKKHYPRLLEMNPALRGLDLESFYRAINKVEASFIRVEADELTYGLHVLLRFELERDLLAQRLKARDLPEAWNAKMKEYLGITPPDDRRGVLQDVHWAEGLLGYFPTYVLGNVISLQLYEAALAARPEISAGIGRGDFSPLKGWLTENIHRHGRKFSASELVQRATGRPIDAKPYLTYLRAKYSEIYRF